MAEKLTARRLSGLAHVCEHMTGSSYPDANIPADGRAAGEALRELWGENCGLRVGLSEMNRALTSVLAEGSAAAPAGKRLYLLRGQEGAEGYVAGAWSPGEKCMKEGTGKTPLLALASLLYSLGWYNVHDILGGDESSAAEGTGE